MDKDYQQELLIVFKNFLRKILHSNNSLLHYPSIVFIYSNFLIKSL